MDKLGLTIERTSYDIDAVYDFSSDPKLYAGTFYGWKSADAPYDSIHGNYLIGEPVVLDLEKIEYIALIDDIPFNNIEFNVNKDTGELVAVYFFLKFDADNGLNQNIYSFQRKLHDTYRYDFKEGVAGGEFSDIRLEAPPMIKSLLLVLCNFK